jgi:hypothetical protein
MGGPVASVGDDTVLGAGVTAVFVVCGEAPGHTGCASPGARGEHVGSQKAWAEAELDRW